MPGLSSSLAATSFSPTALTSTVLRDPAHAGQKTIDVKVLAIKVGTLLFSEISLLIQARLSVAGFELHSPPYAVLPTIFWPEKENMETTDSVYGNLFLSSSLLQL